MLFILAVMNVLPDNAAQTIINSCSEPRINIVCDRDTEPKSCLQVLCEN